jgi:S-adenosylmethionine:tRNA ribosyltransferase-isomerase
MLRPGGRIGAGETLFDRATQTPLVSVLSAPLSGDPRRRVLLECGDEPPLAWLDRVGQPPLPPYIHRPPRPSDRDRYQTIYARERGSVAAPTAGLHFTPELLQRLEQRGIERAEIVLHVGIGTFRPVDAAHIEDHRLDPEPILIPSETRAALSKTRQRGGRIIAVGTTSLRALESTASRAPAQPSSLPEIQSETDLVILPGHRFRAADALITNFHLPKSSLLLLVSAFAGRERILDAYRDAIGRGYRFYSYGDAMLIL